MSSAGVGSGMIGWADRRLEGWSSTGIAVLAALAGMLAAAIVVVGYAVFLRFLGSGEANYVLQFAGTSDRLASRAGEFTLGEARGAQMWGFAFAVVWGVVGYVLFAVFWKHCWNAGPAANAGVVSGIRYLPVAGGALSVIERAITLATLRGGVDDAGAPTVEMLWGAPAIVVTLAWGKWVIGGITVAAVLAMIVSAIARAAQTPLPPGWADAFRAPMATVAAALSDGDEAEVAASSEAERTTAPVHDVGDLHQNQIREVRLSYGPSQAATAAERAQVTPDQEPMPLPDGTGISCSGGGIRAASFALGCLSRLERTPTGEPLPETVLGRARFLSSVSGGGYAAAAWRMAAGPGELPDTPIIGDPCHFEPSVHPFPHKGRATPDLLTHIRERRSFLANGRGGLPRSIVRVIAQMLLHLSLIFVTVYVFAWPFGKLLASWAVRAFDTDTFVETANGIEIDSLTGAHHWVPPALTLAALAPLGLARMFMERNRSRRIVDQIMTGLVLLAAGSGFVLLVLPILVEFVVEVVPAGTNRLVFSGVWAAIVTAAWQLAKRYVRRFVKYLGGVFLAMGLGAFGAFVIDWSMREDDVWLGSWEIFVGLTIFLMVGFILFNPDAWSLHDFYRERLNGTFATQRTAEGLLAEPDPRPMSDYVGVEPSPIICCAAARPPQADTGIAALSMTFEPQAVTIFHWERPEDSQLGELTAAQIPHAEFAALLPRGSRRLDSLMGAAAISGAAVAPSMGRKNFSTTNALLAAFNARLGVWVPNPAYGGPGRELDRKVAPRLVNMFKEIFGVYDPKDPNVYATDGGHWDNLGVVELIRRRCATIIAIDTSGDPLGTYNALKEAIALARHECGAEIDFGDEWDKLVPAEDSIVDHNHMRGTVRYRDGHTATILYVKGAVARTSSLAVQRYAAGDKTFPNYSTGNQMLTDRQLTFLVRLGDEAMATALDENPSVVTDALAPRIDERDEPGDQVGPGIVRS